MSTRAQALLALSWIATTSTSLPAQAAAGQKSSDWPQFRGRQAMGTDDSAALPVRWNVSTGLNIAWKRAVPGLAHSSPIVVAGRVFVTTAAAKGMKSELKVGLYGAGDSAKDMVEHAFQVYCFDAESGALLWVRSAISTKPRFARHTKATHADPSPASDGARVVAVFGAQGMFCYDLEGQEQWRVELGALDVGPHNSPDLMWGYASSPILVDGKVIVQADIKKDGFLAAFDLETGKELWRKRRADVPGWCTPTAYRAPDGWQILVNGCKHMGSYRASDGEELWRMAGGGGIPVPAPVVHGELVYLTSNHRPIQPGQPHKPIFAVRLSARGDLGVPSRDNLGENLAWMHTGQGSYMQTPLVYRGLAYFGKLNGVVAAFDIKDGVRQGRKRLGGGRTGFSASAVAGDGKVYYTSEEGDIYTLRAGADLEVLAHNEMGEVCMATPALSGGRIFVRTQGHLVAIGESANGRDANKK